MQPIFPRPGGLLPKAMGRPPAPVRPCHRRTALHVDPLCVPDLVCDVNHPGHPRSLASANCSAVGLWTRHLTDTDTRRRRATGTMPTHLSALDAGRGLGAATQLRGRVRRLSRGFAAGTILPLGSEDWLHSLLEGRMCFAWMPRMSAQSRSMEIDVNPREQSLEISQL